MKFLEQPSRRFSVYNRKRKLEFLLSYVETKSIRSCLVVGAIPRSNTEEYQNLIEEGILARVKNVAFSGLEVSGMGWPNWTQADGCDLPFENKSFDLVFSNAVIEHVGDFSRQKLFIDEHNRVGRNFMLTTPNRLFPIESHTQVLFRHMSSAWKDESFTRLLSKSDLLEIMPTGSSILGHTASPTFTVYN